MSTSVEILRSPWLIPASIPLDEGIWQSWLEKGRARDVRSIGTRVKLLRLACIGGLLATAALWPGAAAYEFPVKLLISVGAMLLTFELLKQRQFQAGLIAGGVAVLYNPLLPVFPFTGQWQRALVVASTIPFVTSLARKRMKPANGVGSVLASLLLIGLVPATLFGADLSHYREFQLGSDVASILKGTGAAQSEVRTIYSRPALIQELEWHPQSVGPTSQISQTKTLVFRFLNGVLFGITVNYNRYETQGMTADDFVDAISPLYGVPEHPPTPINDSRGPYGDEEKIIARWQDSGHQFDLIRSNYGPTYRLTGNLRELEEQAKAAISVGQRLDSEEEPQRDAARVAAEKEAERVKLEKARLLNKPKFQP